MMCIIQWREMMIMMVGFVLQGSFAENLVFLLVALKKGQLSNVAPFFFAEVLLTSCSLAYRVNMREG